MSFKGYKIMLHPTAEQEDKIQKQFTLYRNYWNLLLALSDQLMQKKPTSPITAWVKVNKAVALDIWEKEVEKA